LKVEFDHLAIWPSTHKPHNLVAVASNVVPEIHDLAQSIHQGLSGFMPEQLEKEKHKVFRPHITLARIGNLKTDTATQEVQVSDVLCGDGNFPLLLPINKICLIESRLQDGISEYEVLAEFSM
jgi:2'-5' RNA ligase